MMYQRYISINLCIVFLHSAGSTPPFDFNRVPEEIFQKILTPFFHDQSEKIYSKNISMTELIDTMQLALAFQHYPYPSAEIIAAADVMRFFSDPCHIVNYINEEPISLVDIEPFSNKISNDFRTAIQEKILLKETPHISIIPFEVHPSVILPINHAFKKPLVRMKRNSLTFFIHDEGKTFMIPDANPHKINNIPHEMPVPYICMACNTEPWPLVIKTPQLIKTLRFDCDTNTISAQRPSPHDLAILQNTHHTIVPLSTTRIRKYILPNLNEATPSVYIPHAGKGVWGMAHHTNDALCILINGTEENGIVTKQTQLFIYPITLCLNLTERLLSLSLLGMKNRQSPAERIIKIIPMLQEAVKELLKNRPITREHILVRIATIESELHTSRPYQLLQKIIPILHTIKDMFETKKITLEYIAKE